MKNTKITITIQSDKEAQFINLLNHFIQPLKEEMNIQITMISCSEYCEQSCNLYFFDRQKLPLSLQEKTNLIAFCDQCLTKTDSVTETDNQIQTVQLPAEMQKMMMLCLEQKNNCLFFVANRQKDCVRNEQIRTITVKGNCSYIQTGNMTYPVYCSLCRMIADHDLTRWMLRASRAVLINPAFIDHVKDDEVHMKDGTVNYISRYYKKDFRKTYNDQFLK